MTSTPPAEPGGRATDTIDPFSTGPLPPDPTAPAGRLPRLAALLTGVVALAAGGLLGVILGWGVAPVVAVAWVVFVVAFPLWSLLVENRRKAVDRLVTTLVWTAFVLAMIPLVSLMVTVVAKGAPAISGNFLTADMSGRALLDGSGGIFHALVGTLLVTVIAAVIAVPVGVLTAVWLVEYGKGTRLAGVITFLVDVMTGIPSIVAGLFAFAFFQVVLAEPLPRLAVGGGVALSLLMLPTVIRAVEEMLKLVPEDLREASYALGVPKWRTIVKVVLPTAVAGIVTGVTLAVARVAGETAPLLLIVGTAYQTNWNPFDGGTATLPTFIFGSLSKTSHFKYGDAWSDAIWGAALVLIVIVMTLNVVARVIGSVFAPKTGK
ncbi:phosphate ABC transporter permease PstA [Nocardioides sp. TF02-7]|uniref:phosphate ABC transporter permease PstA n=1 Tax=Nocardioides sp. TF02-7 TaxID=2917724 RepID=UPI001F053D5A|nr:phosphate ABC transporter permease PstA [Nocardioides sp. TF02-7]UMG91094.1 phosphate ABC transporter permease PstA [Nocardioides sp. TF02-7]